MAGTAYFFLPDTPENARFLNEEDKLVTQARGVRQVGEDLPHRLGKIVWKETLVTVIDPKVDLSNLYYI